MRVGVWLLCMSCFYTWAELSHLCRGHDAGSTRPELDKRPTARVTEHIHRHVGRHRVLHRNRPHGRKASRARSAEAAPRIVHHPSDVVVAAGHPAALSCRADGSPPPAVRWLRNGQRLQTDAPQPMVLSDGSLFFLSVGGGRRGQSHEGVYACVASNGAGTATSRNASLSIAVLQEDFIVQPSDVEVAEGETAVLKCGPPVGRPQPNIMWKKDGVPIDSTDRQYTELSGKLIFAPAEKNHSGSYVCVASNTVGVRESRAARLSVLSKPVLVLKPEDVSATMGESAQFYCQATGDPPPAVVWSREQGPLPNGRYLVNPDQTLQIHYVTAQDAGKYTCTAANDVGVATASAQLQVEEAASTTQKDLHKEMSALRVALENVTISASGSTMSQVQWKLLSPPDQPHYLDGFEVLYRSLLPAVSDWAAQRARLPAFQTLLGPLKRGYKYEIKVRPYGSNLYGRESNTRHLRVPETVPGAAPLAVSVAVSHEQNNTISLSWEPPPYRTHNGIIQGYQVWCVDTEEQQYQNWTVNSGQHSLEIFTLKPHRRYWLTVAAVNGAGVGALSDPYGFVLNSDTGATLHSEIQSGDVSEVWALLQHPVLIGSIGALVWCLLMLAAVCLFTHRSKRGHLILGHSRVKGLQRLASEDLVIKHRMVAPDSPWLSSGWRPAFNHKYHDLWAQGQKTPGISSSSLPVSSISEHGRLDAAIPIVTDSCGVYGTFYVDLMGNGLKTFNSPGRQPKMPHGLSHQQGAETIQIFTQPVATTSAAGRQEVLPWKQAIRLQPKMGVLRESWEKKHSKQELHAVNSVPILSTGNQARSTGAWKQRLSHIPSSRHGGHPENCNAVGCPRLLHYSASVHLVDVLPPPPTIPRDSLTSDEGSSHSTKLTEDMTSVCASAGPCGQPRHNSSFSSNNNNNNNSSSSIPSYCRLSSASYSTTLDEEAGGTLTAQEATQYLELCPKPERCSALPEPRRCLSHPFSGTLGPVGGPPPEHQGAPVGLWHAGLRSSPSSCCSDWDGSLWNTWSSVTEGTLASARSSLISSVDSCCTADSNLARLLAMSGASVSDFSPPASPLSAWFPSLRAGPDSPDLEPVPAWDWRSAWTGEVEAPFRCRCPDRDNKPSDT
ncbi:roundabout homolog 4 isoform X2 [Betta splendens]|uniref:Roundabout homolog 4 isoform X2 n=1 Tax=Betta splendens TaxID=158456 RepID=A0A6P7PL55_BETSP|nr:roundabout homolog 4 isoform X2 [Betta splendens]